MSWTLLTREQAVRIGNMADEAWCDTVRIRYDESTSGSVKVSLVPYSEDTDEYGDEIDYLVASDGEVTKP